MEHTVSIEMQSKRYVKTITLSNQTYTRVLFEGNLGELIDVSLVEGDILEVTGSHGILRLDLTKEQLLKALEDNDRVANLNAEVGRTQPRKYQEIIEEMCDDCGYQAFRAYHHIREDQTGYEYWDEREPQEMYERKQRRAEQICSHYPTPSFRRGECIAAEEEFLGYRRDDGHREEERDDIEAGFRDR